MQAVFDIPEELHQADFTRLIFHLRFLQEFELTLEAFLRLRRGLIQAAQELDRQQSGSDAEALFEPPLADDPVARRRFQRPAPSFTLRPCLASFGDCVEGSSVPLEVLFLGEGIKQIPIFARTLQRLGEHGLFLGKGPFEIRAIDSINSSEGCQPLWAQGESLEQLTPMVNNCAWWLESQPGPDAPLILDFQTPTRLLSNGRPLFEPDMEQIFPFILRRVTSMLYAHCGMEVVKDPVELLEGACQLHVKQRDLVWEDWRTLSGRQDLGGIQGRLVLEGDALQELLWVFYLGSLFQIGKGASYGAGSYQAIFAA